MKINTPDIGVDKALVSEILVKVGDVVEIDQSIMVLESDKATVEVPSTVAGVVKAILVNKDDSVSEGVELIEIEANATVDSTSAPVEAPVQNTSAPIVETATVTPVSAPQASASVEITVPDIGVDKALVTEILVKVGDTIEIDQSIAVLESDKATVEVPSTVAGVVEAIHITLNQSVSQGVALIQVSSQQGASQVTEKTVVETTAPTTAPATNASVDVNVPDIGVDKALVTEILVKVGDTIELEQSIAVLESDKASTEVPSTVAGVVEAVYVELNQSVSQGVALIKVASQQVAQQTPQATQASVATTAPVTQASSAKAVTEQKVAVATTTTTSKLTAAQEAENAKVYAGPAVRKLARELGVVLSQVKATGEHQRILKDDVFAYVKERLVACEVQLPLNGTTAPVQAGLPPLPDFTAFGGGEVQVMTRLQQVSVPQLSLNNFIPQVTQFDLADITELEAWRNELKDGFKKQGISLTILAFIAKAVAHLLLEERYFASHLADDQKSVLLRNEIHMGIAVATPDGLTVPVLRNPDQKSIKQIAQELMELSQKARDKKLSPKDLQGANFTITSLGSIGGTAFTPLVNWPQVAILGLSPAKMQPVWNGKDFEPRLMLPLSLSYDHRVINGADAARFTNKLTKLLQDIRTLLL